MLTQDKIHILNCSPRGAASNSRLLIDYFINGYARVRNEQIQVHYLKQMKEPEDQLRLFKTADYLILVMPLYTDAMPGIVKELIDHLASEKGSLAHLKLGFVVHSGFPEGHHSVYLARYLEKLSRKLGSEYLGAVIKGGSEGIKLMPDWMKSKTIDRFTELGRQFALQGIFDQSITNQLRSPYQLSSKGVLVFRLLKFLHIGDWYWNSQLKKNGAYDQRYARPYGTNKLLEKPS